MGKYIKLFETHSAYNTYINGQDKILPNVSYCENENEVHYNPWTDPKLVCKYNITDTTSATALRTEYEQNMFKSMEIDGVLLDSLVTEYQFDTTGEHTVKYELYDETKVGNNAPLFNQIATLTSASIPNSVTTIGQNAFFGCSGLTSVTIPSNVSSIGQYAFNGCTGITSVTIPNSVTYIGGNAFDGCTNLTSVTINSNSIMNKESTVLAFFGNQVTEYIIGETVTSIGDYAFYGCSGLTSVTIPNSVTSIGNSAFYDCTGLTSIISLATTAPTITSTTFSSINTGGTLYVPTGSTGYDTWMGTGDYYLGKYNWTKVEQ